MLLEWLHGSSIVVYYSLDIELSLPGVESTQRNPPVDQPVDLVINSTQSTDRQILANQLHDSFRKYQWIYIGVLPILYSKILVMILGTFVYV